MGQRCLCRDPAEAAPTTDPSTAVGAHLAARHPTIHRPAPLTWYPPRAPQRWEAAQGLCSRYTAESRKHSLAEIPLAQEDPWALESPRDCPPAPENGGLRELLARERGKPAEDGGRQGPWDMSSAFQGSSRGTCSVHGAPAGATLSTGSTCGSRRDTPTITSLILSAMFLPVGLLLAISPKTLIRSDLLWVSVNKVVFPPSHPEPQPPPVLPQAPSRREARPAPGLWPPCSASHLTLQHPLLE